MDDVVDNGLDRRVDRYRHRALVGRGPLQRSELAVEQACRHEMALARRQAPGNQRLRAVEEDEAHVAAAMDEHLTIGPPERGAGEYRTLLLAAETVDLVGDRLQPGPAVLVGQRLACA